VGNAEQLVCVCRTGELLSQVNTNAELFSLLVPLFSQKRKIFLFFFCIVATFKGCKSYFGVEVEKKVFPQSPVLGLKTRLLCPISARSQPIF